MSKFCPNCDRQYEWYESECTDCRVALVDTAPAGAPNPDGSIVSVFETSEPGLLALVKLTLDQQGIEYIERVRPEDSFVAGGEVMRGDQSVAVVEILVASDLADETRALLESLGSDAGVPIHEPVPTSGVLPLTDDGVVELIDTETNQRIGEIPASQFDWLAGQLERESDEDEDFYIDAATLDMLQDRGGEPGLILLLRTALGSREGIEIRGH